LVAIVSNVEAGLQILHAECLGHFDHDLLFEKKFVLGVPVEFHALDIPGVHSAKSQVLGIVLQSFLIQERYFCILIFHAS
jgi:hypothetical protein